MIHRLENEKSALMEITPASSPRPVVFVYQRMLPYHQARFATLNRALGSLGYPCLAVEVAHLDNSYGEIGDMSSQFEETSLHRQVICLFTATNYLDLKPRQVSSAVYRILRDLQPRVVFAPAPAFAEGAGSLHYKVCYGGKLILMDDAWEMTDRRSGLTRTVKRLLYGFYDGGFFPDNLHGHYFASMNIPLERQRYAVDVVGPVFDSDLDKQTTMPLLGRPYVLFVGRLISRKGLEVVLYALAAMANDSLYLVVIGDGPEREALLAKVDELGLAHQVRWLGRQSNSIARRWMIQAMAVLVPSHFEQWGLVVNEAWMVPTLVLGSNTVGALRATYPLEMEWMLLPVSDVSAWQAALEQLIALSPQERSYLLNVSAKLAEKYSLVSHTQSALSLIELSLRSRPSVVVAWLAQLWNGRVAVW